MQRPAANIGSSEALVAICIPPVTAVATVLVILHAFPEGARIGRNTAGWSQNVICSRPQTQTPFAVLFHKLTLCMKAWRKYKLRWFLYQKYNYMLHN
jgi:hypothetical protein